MRFCGGAIPCLDSGNAHSLIRIPTSCISKTANMKRSLLLVATALTCGSFTFPTSAFSASFNCSRAGSVAEKLVCNDAELSALDDQLGKTYRLAKNKAADRRAFAVQSDGFWRWREANCHSRDCLIDWYRQRQAMLDATLRGEAATTTTLISMPATLLNNKPPAAASAALPARTLSDEQIQTALMQVQKSTTPALSELPPALMAVLPRSPAPLQPHYVSKTEDEYFYEDLTTATATDAIPLVTVRYLGSIQGQYTLEVQKKSGKIRYTCANDCAYIKQLALPGYGLHDLDIFKNDHTSLASLMMRDAMNGLLVPSTR